MHPLARVGVLVFLLPSVTLAQDPPRSGAAPEFDAAATTRLLVSADAAQRRAACESLKGRWNEAAMFVPALVFALDDESPDVRKAAAVTLDGMGARAADVLAGFLDVYERGEPPLLTPLPLLGTWGTHDDPPPSRIRIEECLATLFRLGPAVTLRDLTSSLTYRGGAARRVDMAICAGFDHDEWGPDLLMPQVHLVAYSADPGSGDIATASLVLQGRAAAVRRELIGVGAPPVGVAAWTRHLRSKRPGVRWLAALYVARWGPSTSAPVGELAKALSELPPAARVPPLEVMDAPAPHDVTVCIAALHALGASAKPAVPDIGRHAAAGHEESIALLCDLVPFSELRRWFPAGLPERALWRLAETTSPEPAVREFLTSILLTPPNHRFPRAARLLSRLGGDVDGLVTRLDQAAGDDEDSALAACWLAGLPTARVSALAKWIDRQPGRSDVEAEIVRMGVRAAPLGAPACRAIDDSPVLFPSTIERLVALGPAAKDAVPLLVRDLGAKHEFMEAPWDYRSLALLALEKIGPAAAASLETVQKLKSDPQPWIAYLAARAERAIAPR